MRKRTIACGTLGLLGLSLAAYAAYELVFSEPVELSTQEPDIGLAYKSKITGLPDGRLVVVYGDAVEDEPNHYVYDTKGDYDRPARDVFVRTCASKTTDCTVETNWSAPVNISNTALSSTINTDWDGDTDGDNTRKPAYGDAGKPNVFAAGSRIVATWVGTYCEGGLQRTVTYAERQNREVPFNCMYASHSNNSGLTWSAAVQLSTAERDAAVDLSRGSSNGRWVITWQEDPLGLKLGEAEGPGDGASGANVSAGTDIWYAYSGNLNTPIGGGIGVWSSPVRLTNNADGSPLVGEYDVIRDADGNVLDAANLEGGNSGASRANTALVGSTVITAYEEKKGGGQGVFGKFIRYHTFTYNNIAGTNDPVGCIVSNPAENARRVRFVQQGTPGPVSGITWAIFWREGMGQQGAPADIMARLGYTDFASTNLVPTVDPACNASDYATAQALVNAPALNLSHESENGGDLTATTALNGIEDAKAHRGLLRGDDLSIGWTYTPDWQLARETTEENYNFFLRRYGADSDTWTEPVNMTNVDDTTIDVKEPRLVGTPGTSGTGCPSGNPTDPGTTDPEDCTNPNVFYVAWGTEVNTPEQIGSPTPLDLYITRTTDKGATFEPAQVFSGAAEEGEEDEDSESQLRVTPAGNIVSVVWNRDSDAGSEAEFAQGVATFYPEADLGLAAAASVSSVRVGISFSVTFTATNGGPQDATNVVIDGVLPDNVTVTSNGGCVVAGTSFTCTTAALAAGASQAYTLTVQATALGDAVFSAEVSGAERDPVADNNVASVSVETLPEADLGLAGSAIVSSVRTGSSFSVTFRATNGGPQDATNVVIDGTLPDNVTVTSNGGCVVAGTSFTCTTAALAAGASQAYTLTVQATAVGDAVFSAEVSGAEVDPLPANNVASVSVDVLRKRSSGGCAYAPGSGIDPTLPLLLVGGLAGLMFRRRRLAGELRA